MSESATIAVGDELPPLTKTLDRLDLVKYAAGSGDFNPLHYDPDFPQARDIGDNIVHGREVRRTRRVVSDSAEPPGLVRRISASYRGMDRRGTSFTCQGRVTSVREEDGRRIVELELWTQDADGLATTGGSAEVALEP